MAPDGGRPVVAGAGRFTGFLDAIVVVTGAFDRAGAGPFTTRRVEQVGDLGQQVRECLIPVLRGECPPSR